MGQVPGMGARDLDDARVVLHAEGCTDVRSMITANATRVEERLPPAEAPSPTAPGGVEVAVTLTECRTVRVDGTVHRNATLADVSVPVQGSVDAGPARGVDRTLWLVTDDLGIAKALRDAGAPVTSAATVELEADTLHDMIDRFPLRIESGPAEVDGTATSVAIGVDVPFGVGTSVGRDRVVGGDGGADLHLACGVDVREVGGLSGTIDMLPRTDPAKTVGNTTRSAHGVQSGHDARVGVLPVG